MKIYPGMRSVLSILVLLCAVSLFGSLARAQQTLGAINGTVTDTSDAGVADATVSATADATGLTRATKTQKSGYFEILNLPVGRYTITITHEGFDTTRLPAIAVQEARAATVNATLKVGKVSESVTVNANPLLNATDTTNGYTLDSQQIAMTPLATGSFTQLAVLAPGVNTELLSGLDTNAGLGNQPIWANGQRDTSNTFQVNGVDVSNIFNGKSSSGTTSQRYNFNIGAGSTSSSSSAGAATIGGANPTGTSVFGSNGNNLPSPPPEFITELRVNTSMYDALQGATSGAQIDVNTATGSNNWHGQTYGTFANNSMNASPFFFNQAYQLSQQGVGAFPRSLVVPPLHRWTTGATLGGPIKKNKAFVFIAYQHLYDSDQSTGLSQFNVPPGLTDDRSVTGLTAAASAWLGAPFTGTVSSVAQTLMSAKLPNGQYLIPSPQVAGPFQYGVPNVTLQGTSLMTGNQATAAVDFNVSNTDHLTVKYYYQNIPVNKPFNTSSTAGFPQSQNNGSQVASLDNTITFGPHINWEQTLGFSRMGSYTYYTQQMSCSSDPTCGINAAYPGAPAGQTFNFLPGLLLEQFAADTTASPSLKVGPYSAFTNMGYYQNRVNPRTNLILVLGNHTLSVGGGYSYTQLNITNNRTGIALVTATNFEDFLEGQTKSANVLDTIGDGRNLADRYYRTNEISTYGQDKWQLLSNLTITAGLRYDYHGGMTEKYGNIFNFDPKAYNVTGTSTSGFNVSNAGFVVAGNNKYFPTPGVSDSTLTGRQWGISPRVGFAWSPKQNHGTVVFRGGFGLYFDRGEYFDYLSQPAGSGIGGPFGATESSPLAAYVTAGRGSLGAPLAKVNPYTPPSANPAVLTQALQSTLNVMTGETTFFDGSTGPTCGAIANQEVGDCPSPLNFGAYNKNNVLPYTMNFAFNMQWQPANDLAVTIGYVGNRGRHAVIPIPLNEPVIATTMNPIHGEQYSYGFGVLNQNACGGPYCEDFAPIANEPWSTYDGGNVDFRAPYVGFSPNAASFETVGTSAYDALETHLEKRLSHNYQVGASYTFSHTYDEQSDIGLFFTGDNPNDLRTSYAPSDFDRTHVFSASFLVNVPNTADPHSFLGYLANDWHLSGIAILQSGQPYSLYEFYGAVGSVYFGNFPTLMNPVLGIKDPKRPYSALTGNSGKYRGLGGSFIPTIDPSQLDIHYLAPGEKGIPISTGTDPQDIYETDFAPGQRNLFRQAPQKSLNISMRKNLMVKERFNLEYQFNIFNVTNTTSLDIPQDQTQIRQSYACSATAASSYNCQHGYVYGEVVTANNPVDQQSALVDLDQLPYHNGSGKSTTIPTTLPVGTLSCTKATISNGCPNNGANFGSVTGAIGGPRVITMGLRVQF
ncbi:MAG: carboxypeptidase regulatory-like domain-containing protein [Silvibacterium sp.]